ncbi:MAG: Lrp/AsnC family transcriptional regulator [Pseudomonadota bacterium]
MTTAFIYLQCKPGTAYKVAEELALLELHSEIYSITGEFDLMIKVYVPKDEDLGLFVNTKLLVSDDIVRSMTTQAFKAFH